MSHDERLVKASAIKTVHKQLCDQRGSEFHANHPYCPQKQGRPPLSENLICFEAPRDCHFVGKDAAKVENALASLPGNNDPQAMPDVRKALLAHSVVTLTGEGDAASLTFDRRHLNDVLRALEMADL